MSTRYFINISILLSVVIHIMLYFIGAQVPLSGVVAEAARKSIDAEEVEYVPIKLANINEVIDKVLSETPSAAADPNAVPLPEITDPLTGEKLTPEANLKDLQSAADMNTIGKSEVSPVEKILQQADLIEKPRQIYKLDGVNREEHNVMAQPMPKDALKPTAPRPEILEIPLEELNPDRRNLQGRMVRAIQHRVAVPNAIPLPSFAAEGDLAAASLYNTVENVTLKARRPKFSAPSANLKDLGLDDDLSDVAAPPVEEAVKSDLPEINVGRENLSSAKALDRLVRVDVTVQRDAAGAGGCYQVDITPAPGSDSMPEIPKDILFILDRSNSITEAKFKRFKKAIQEALPALSPHDRFNVVAFNDKNYKVFTDFAVASPQNITQAIENVGQLSYGGQTDVFKGLAPFVQNTSKNSKRPLNIFILTDGRSTVNIYQPNVFLRQILEMNPGNVSIFPFSAGDNTNRQLLDFLGYLNHGDKCHTPELSKVRDGMVRFFAQYNSMIVNGLNCDTVAGGNASEVYPKSLSNLYRGQSLRLYGRFENCQSELVLRLTGRDANGQICDLVFRRPLLGCKPGDARLQTRWAAQKVLYLLGRRNSTDNPAEISSLNAQIERIVRKYKLYSGY